MCAMPSPAQETSSQTLVRAKPCIGRGPWAANWGKAMGTPPRMGLTPDCTSEHVRWVERLAFDIVGVVHKIAHAVQGPFKLCHWSAEESRISL